MGDLCEYLSMKLRLLDFPCRFQAIIIFGIRSICFVVRRGESKYFESMAKKIVLKLEYLEREKGFLQQSNILVGIVKNIDRIDYHGGNT